VSSKSNGTRSAPWEKVGVTARKTKNHHGSRITHHELRFMTIEGIIKKWIRQNLVQVPIGEY
jgi:hypothetical protein